MRLILSHLVAPGYRRRWFDRLVAPLLAILLVAAARLPFAGRRIRAVGAGFVVDDPVVTSGVLVVLGGGSVERARWAAEHYRSGIATRVLLFTDARKESLAAHGVPSSLQLLLDAGVPGDAIAHLLDAPDTAAEARLAVSWMRDHSAASAVVVTEWYHSRRAARLFRAQAGRSGVRVSVSVPPASLHQGRAWWTDRACAADLSGEFVAELLYR